MQTHSATSIIHNQKLSSRVYARRCVTDDAGQDQTIDSESGIHRVVDTTKTLDGTLVIIPFAAAALLVVITNLLVAFLQ